MTEHPLILCVDCRHVDGDLCAHPKRSELPERQRSTIWQIGSGFLLDCGPDHHDWEPRNG